MKKIVWNILAIIVIIIVFTWINVVLIDDNKIVSPEYASENEYVITIDCAPLFDSYTLGTKYKICFDLKAKKQGDVIVYQQNGSTSRYECPYQIVKAKEEYTHYEVEVEPVLVDESEPCSYLSFYGFYGTGVIPTIKNISIEPIS